MNRLAVLAAGVVLTAGCSSGGDGLNRPAIAWADQVCQTVQDGGAKLSQLPRIDGADPHQAKTSLLAYLGSIAEAIDSVSDRLTQSGAPPVAEGQAAVDKAMATLTSARGTLDSARGKLQQAQTTDPVSFQKAVAEVGAGLEPLSGAVGPTKDLRANKELDVAFSHAPTCQRLDGQKTG
ncbi:hypothetical protein [Kibdelosporangium phytohabitans]|uniref:Small secreted protein n=1 Tax=Kibdelosporangium phytohabitans TaxID=860235 RepID=A0A0N9I2G2_9PSEU|nr:hypothetical protein [Kibdelosporangium phytohabitans]ALG11873.1 hypothetical protein AOZ06_37860 [Kibdelosporangium phytohabitans]MBE1463309.1 hypothetical protein [Kibdelosporangium phytohabitans]